MTELSDETKYTAALAEEYTGAPRRDTTHDG
jgi:hypothetical protein